MGKICVLDANPGETLRKMGMPLGAFTEKWAIDNGDRLIEFHKSCVEAGSTVLYAPTAGINSLALERFGVSGSIDEMCRRAIELTRTAAGDKAMAAGTMGPSGKRPAPFGDGDYYELLGLFTEQVRGIENAGADMFALVSQKYVSEAAIALEAVRNMSDKAVSVSFRFGENGKTADGYSPAEALEQLSCWGLCAFGADDVGSGEVNLAIVQELKACTEGTIIMRPSAGAPVIGPEGVGYSASPEQFAALCARLAEAGATHIGGGSGTDARYIAALKAGV